MREEIFDVSRDNRKVASENRPVGTASEPTRKGDSGTDETSGDATQTAAESSIPFSPQQMRKELRGAADVGKGRSTSCDPLVGGGEQ